VGCGVPIADTEFFSKKALTANPTESRTHKEGPHLPQDAPQRVRWWGRLSVFGGGFQRNGEVLYFQLALTGRLPAGFRWFRWWSGAFDCFNDRRQVR